MKKHNQLLLLSCLFLLTPFSVQSSSEQQVQPAVVLNKSNVIAEPKRSAKVLYQLDEEHPVVILERHRSWYKIKAENQADGWIRLINVKYLGETKSSSGGFFSSMARVSRTGPTVTTGVRGIDLAEFKNATPDVATLNLILAQKTSQTRVNSFAKQGSLKVKNVALPASKYKEQTDD